QIGARRAIPPIGGGLEIGGEKIVGAAHSSPQSLRVIRTSTATALSSVTITGLTSILSINWRASVSGPHHCAILSRLPRISPFGPYRPLDGRKCCAAAFSEAVARRVVQSLVIRRRSSGRSS